MDDQLDANPGKPQKETATKTLEDNGNDSTVSSISKSHLDKEDYPIGSGIVVIINNTEFASNLNLPDRTGSDVDASSLYQRFQELDFDCDLLNDATYSDMEEKFEEIKEDKETLKTAGCLIVALLTHGNKGGIYTTDREVKIKTIMDHFNASNCEELILKPKIFLIQACRGTEIGSGVNKRTRRGDPNQPDCTAQYTDYDKIYGDIVRIPNEADFLAVCATSDGYAAFRNTKTGSPFVRVLAEEIFKMKKGEDFYKVLTRVNRKVGMNFNPNYSGADNPTQMPCFVSHLTKNLVLKQ